MHCPNPTEVDPMEFNMTNQMTGMKLDKDFVPPGGGNGELQDFKNNTLSPDSLEIKISIWSLTYYFENILLFQFIVFLDTTPQYKNTAYTS